MFRDEPTNEEKKKARVWHDDTAHDKSPAKAIPETFASSQTIGKGQEKPKQH